jgi:hypothetical protein
MVKLNVERIEHTLKDMKPGESAWTTPWAMSITEDREWFLNENYTAYESPGGTVSMLVTRNRRGGYEVDITGCRDYQWRPARYHSGSGWFAIPVERLTQ